MADKSLYKRLIVKYLILSLFLLISVHLYYRILSPRVGVWMIIIADILAIALWIFSEVRWLSKIHNNLINIIKESFTDSDFIEELGCNLDLDGFPTDIVDKIIKHQQDQEKEQQALLEKLRNNNILLERNSKITDSIMHITSEILSSGKIDEVLQTILNKALDIIPNAQKGSILIYNGSTLEFRACKGYNFEVLKNLRFGIEEIFQHDSVDFYEPCIINNPESYNKEHLTSGKYEMLKEGRGFEIKSILSCAIQVDNEFYGVINMDNTEDSYAFSKEDKPLIKHLAAQIGIALKNARLIEKILYLSRHDSLTGIYNRCYFEELLMNTFQNCNAAGSIFSLALLDINGLKSTNDTYGHEAGDLLLINFVQGVKEKLTKDDIFSRHGGDEFAIIFTDKSKAQAEAIIKSIRSLLAKACYTYCGNEIKSISFGCGVTEFPTETAEFKKLMVLADSRLYEDKANKKPIR